MALPTLGVLDGAGDPQTVNTPNSGRQAAASSQAMVLATEDKAALDKLSPRAFSATVTTLTRPANTTAYAINDSISDNATAGSVTALSASPSDTNDDPVLITGMLVDTNDTGLAAGVLIRVYLYNSDPTASSGVGAGDNAAFSNKKAGFIGCLSGTFKAFSDGGRARLVPEEGSFIIAPPTSGAKTIYVQYQTLGAFTPSANSTTLIGTLLGEQRRAA